MPCLYGWVPAEVAYALAAADEVTVRQARTTGAAELVVERAQYDADRAERAFHADEPEPDRAAL